jgi:hydroxypyruvate isomerase
MSGVAPAGVPRDTLTGVYAANLAWAAEEAAKSGVKPLIEPINHRDIPGMFLNTLDQGAAMIAAVGPERLGLQFDLYHCQVTEGDIVTRVEKHLPIIGHMQVADVPGRHEPGTGEVNWPFVFGRIDALGYRGWIGCEYRPAGRTEDGLGWFSPYQHQSI